MFGLDCENDLLKIIPLETENGKYKPRIQNLVNISTLSNLKKAFMSS